MTVIFDFDGTIADSFSAVVAIIHKLLHRSELATAAEIKSFSKMPPLKIAKELGIPKWRIPFLIVLGRREMSHRIKDVQLFAGMLETIKQAKAYGHQLFIMSSNSTSNVDKFLRQQKLDKYFEKVYGGVGLLSKARVLRRIIKSNGLDPNQTIYIGDEARDIEASTEAGVKCIAVTWGFSSEKLLKVHKPYAIAYTPEKLLSLLRTGTIK